MDPIDSNITPISAADLSRVTRVSVIGPDGTAYEDYSVLPGGAQIMIQDDGQTLKIFPA